MGRKNPRIIYKKPVSLWSCSVIGSYFCENAVSEVAIGYRKMITYVFLLELTNTNLEDIWFLQNGTTFNFAYETIQLVNEKIDCVRSIKTFHNQFLG